MKYEILQNTPDVIKGTIGILASKDRYEFPTKEGSIYKKRHYPKDVVENSPEWFRKVSETPTYEEGEWIGLLPYDRNCITENDIIGIGRVKNIHYDFTIFSEYYLFDTIVGVEDFKWLTSFTRKVKRETIEEFLILEAKRRGFKEGVTIDRQQCTTINSYSRDVVDVKRLSGVDEFEYIETATIKDTLSFFGYFIYCKGQWAEIVKKEKITVNGYKLERDGYKLNFGCARFCLDQFKHILYFNDFNRYLKVENVLNRKIKSITLDSGVTIDIKTIQNIVEEEENGK